MNTSDAIAAERIVAGFGASTVLHGVDVAVAPGTSTGLFGLNGAGKSVTMKVLVGLVPCRAGTVTMAGHDVTREAPEDRVRRGLAYVPQGRQVFPRLTVEQNIRLGGAVLRRRNRRRAVEVADGIYERFPRLAERRNQLAGLMSGGEQAMLAIGRALAGDPQVLLIDEPSAGLAPTIVEEVFHMLQVLRAEGMTMVLVEQNITFGFRLVDRATILEGGRVVYDGAVAELDTARVASLLGVGRLLGPRLEQVVGARAVIPAPRPRPRRARPRG